MKVGDLVKLTDYGANTKYGVVTIDGQFNVRVQLSDRVTSQWVSKEYLEVVK
jgi:hypothetical protein